MRSMWIVLGLAGALLMAQGPVPVEKQPPPRHEHPTDPPRLSVEPRGRLKIPGTLGPREKKVLTYTFTNTSAAPISLRALDLSPGVTVAGPVLQKPLAAGESATLTMTIDVTDFIGWQRRNVRLATDDPRQGDYLLPTEMTIRPDLTVDAGRKGFGQVGSHERPQLAFRFTRETGDPTLVRLVSPLPEYLQSEVETEGNITELRLVFDPSKVAPGVALGLETLQVETNAPHQPKFTLYAEWTLRRVVDAKPARLVFLDEKKPRLSLDLKRPDGKPFTIEVATVEGAGFTLTKVTKGAARKHRLVVQRNAEQETRAMLKLRFQGEDEILSVPLAYLPTQ